MTTVLLYWSNICILHKKEKEVLSQAFQTLEQQGIQLQIRYFGLGYGEQMSEYLAKEDAIIPDMIVTTDLEVFEDTRLFPKLGALQNTTNLLSLQPSPAQEIVQRDPTLLPILAIPLVYYTRENNSSPCSIWEKEGLVLGGINNSALKSVTKALWCHKGDACAHQLLSQCGAMGMPIEAFAAVQKQQATTALVPSVYALRGDGTTSFLQHPEEGVFLCPSYLTASEKISPQVAATVTQTIFSQEFCDFYVEQGDLILFPSVTTKKSQQQGDRYCLATQDFFHKVSPEEFYALYTTYLPTAKMPAFG